MQTSYCGLYCNTDPGNLLRFKYLLHLRLLLSYYTLAILLHLGASVKASLRGGGNRARQPRSMSKDMSITALPISADFSAHDNLLDIRKSGAHDRPELLDILEPCSCSLTSDELHLVSSTLPSTAGLQPTPCEPEPCETIAVSSSFPQDTSSLFD